jgi:pyrimidine operon attenuation protein / uracil phosphoribosyltransferase
MAPAGWDATHLLSLARAEKPSHRRRLPPQTDAVATSKTIGAVEIEAAIERLARDISRRHAGAERLLLLGIANGGIELARRLHRRLTALKPPVPTTWGTLDISFHRDDIASHPIPKEFSPTHIPADVHGASIVLVDDVLFTGRTVKAALDELFDHGRPAKVELAILVDRGGRLLPVAADYTGLTLTAGADEKVRVLLDSEKPSRDLVRVERLATASQKSRP